MTRALVKETGEILKIEGEHKIIGMKIKIKFDDSSTSTGTTKTTFTHKTFPNPKEGRYYTLSDNKSYHEDDVIVGMDNIRDNRIDAIIE